MTQDADQGAASATYSSWRSGDAADAPVAAAAGGAMTLGSILTVAGILLLFVVFAFGLVSLQYCFRAWDRERRQQQHGGAAPGRRRRGGVRRASRVVGVDPELLRSLPVTVYSAAAAPGSKEEGSAPECAVCLAELQDGEAARFLPRCGHAFHAECVDTWLASHTTCPLCRLTVANPDAPPCPAAMLPPVAPEPAHYPVLLGVSDHGAVTTVTAPTGPTGVLVIEIPELAAPTTAPRDAIKSPLARLGEAEIVVQEVVELREARGGGELLLLLCRCRRRSRLGAGGSAVAPTGRRAAPNFRALCDSADSHSMLQI